MEQDPLGRNVTITDAARGGTRYGYGPFGALDAVTHSPRDALGRVRQVTDPDRGTTFLVHDGFGNLVTSDDALGRTITPEKEGKMVLQCWMAMIKATINVT